MLQARTLHDVLTKADDMLLLLVGNQPTFRFKWIDAYTLQFTEAIPEWNKAIDAIREEW